MQHSFHNTSDKPPVPPLNCGLSCSQSRLSEPDTISSRGTILQVVYPDALLAQLLSPSRHYQRCAAEQPAAHSLPRAYCCGDWLMKRKDSIPLDGYRRVKIPPYFVIPSRYLPASLLSSSLLDFFNSNSGPRRWGPTIGRCVVWPAFMTTSFLFLVSVPWSWAPRFLNGVTSGGNRNWGEPTCSPRPTSSAWRLQLLQLGGWPACFPTIGRARHG
ncbi:hypothetical protein VTI28DRAFT_4544 [Corynascus sepedonium]